MTHAHHLSGPVPLRERCRGHGTARELPGVRRVGSLLESVSAPLGLHRFGHDHKHTHDVAAAEDDVLAAFREQARELHDRVVHQRGVFVVEFLGATGAGKTRLVERLVGRAPPDERIGAIVGDVAGDDDAARLRALGLDVVNVNTGKECHLDPGLVEEALADLDLGSLDTVFVENVGNMVCPADFPLGASVRVLVVSTTEGDDVVRKHPLLFRSCDAAVVNKADLADAVGADVERMLDDAIDLAPELWTTAASAETGRGIDDLVGFLDEQRTRGHRNHHG